MWREVWRWLASRFLFVTILAFCLKSRDNKGKAEVMTVLTFKQYWPFSETIWQKIWRKKSSPAAEAMFASPGTEEDRELCGWGPLPDTGRIV